MPRTYKTKNLRVNYDNRILNMALREVRRGYPLRDVAERYGVPKSTLGKYRNVANVNDVKIGGGRKPKLSQREEDDLEKYLYASGKYGYGLTKQELLQFVKEYCEHTGNAGWNEKGPGREWYEGFMRRHPRLSIRKGETLSSQRLRGADPYTIKKWYQELARLYKEAKITEEDGKFVYNCDETGFSHDPKDVKLIAPKGQKRVSKNIAGSGKKNTTVLVCGNASGDKLPPYIIFKGTYMWKNWIPKDGYTDTLYGVQKKGWMNTYLFYQWLTELFIPFVKTSEERGGRKVILIFDGASVHISYKVAKAAVDNDIILMKLPANVTHYMQPLDKCVFKPMKVAWNHELIKYNRDFPGRLLPNDEFSRKIKVIWENSFKADYLTSGFRSTGLFPVNCLKFPEEGYDIIKLKKLRDQEQQPQEHQPQEQQHVVGLAAAQPTHSSDMETFIITKLSENLSKKISTQARKRISNDIGAVITSKAALKILQEADTKTKPGKSNFKEKKQTNKGRKNKVSSSSSSDSEIEIELGSSDLEDFDEVSDEAIGINVTDPDMDVSIDPDQVQCGRFIVVEFTYNLGTKKETKKKFVARVVDSNCNNEYKVNCLRKYKEKNNVFVYPQVQYEEIVAFNQIKSLLEDPKVDRGRHVFRNPVDM